MDYTKLTKQDLIKLLEDSDVEVVESLKAKIKDLERTNEELRNMEYTRIKEKEIIGGKLAKAEEEQVENKGKIKFLEHKLNELAQLFETYVVSYKDQVSLIGVLHRNAKSIEELLDSKIESFNGGKQQ